MTAPLSRKECRDLSELIERSLWLSIFLWRATRIEQVANTNTIEFASVLEAEEFQKLLRVAFRRAAKDAPHQVTEGDSQESLRSHEPNNAGAKL